MFLRIILKSRRPFDSFVSNNIEISGDGEIGMNNFDSAVIAIKLGVSAIIAAVVLTVCRRLVRQSR
ncbi:hypothetical protein FKD06_14660 [Serratia sp. SRS-8-S-2018]|nr:hypothetical protein CDA58_12745 [Serratia marcescens]RZF19397.1 hypothetical protein B7L62_01200 [Serratia marcescens]TPW47810.1 hypothetical protein FKD06_14660 [Serratia sp. SRS-8-S-2018]